MDEVVALVVGMHRAEGLSTCKVGGHRNMKMRMLEDLGPFILN